MLFLMSSDLFVRILMTDSRFDDVLDWAHQVPVSWPAAHSSATLARAWIAYCRGEPETADAIHDALTEAASLQLTPFVIEALELLAVHLVDSTHPDHAARLLGAAGAARQRIGAHWRYPYHQAAIDDAHRRLSETVGDTTFRALRADGAQTDLDSTIEFAQRMRGPRSRPTHGWAALTPAEVAVAREIAAGHTNTQAANTLFIAASTVKSHLERIYAKLAIHGRAALATEVARHPES
jgi:DNA-binding CsgD family transcriptional regulator